MNRSKHLYAINGKTEVKIVDPEEEYIEALQKIGIVEMPLKEKGVFSIKRKSK